MSGTNTMFSGVGERAHAFPSSRAQQAKMEIKHGK